MLIIINVGTVQEKRIHTAEPRNNETAGESQQQLVGKELVGTTLAGVSLLISVVLPVMSVSVYICDMSRNKELFFYLTLQLERTSPASPFRGRCRHNITICTVRVVRQHRL